MYKSSHPLKTNGPLEAPKMGWAFCIDVIFFLGGMPFSGSKCWFFFSFQILIGLCFVGRIPTFFCLLLTNWGGGVDVFVESLQTIRPLYIVAFCLVSNITRKINLITYFFNNYPDLTTPVVVWFTSIVYGHTSNCLTYILPGCPKHPHRLKKKSSSQKYKFNQIQN